MFYTYVDWTQEEASRPFYVGKGSASRVSHVPRNELHSAVVARYGHRRQIVCVTPDEGEAFDHEIRLIAEHHTYIKDIDYNGIGCNKTPGGEGWYGVNGKPVLRCTLDGSVVNRFSSLAEAVQVTGSNMGTISHVLNGTRKLLDVDGFTWRYENPQDLEPRRVYAKRANCKRVLVHDSVGNLIVEYASVSDAAAVIGMNRLRLGYVLHGKRPQSDIPSTREGQEDTWSFDPGVKHARKPALTVKLAASISRALRGVSKSPTHRQRLSLSHNKPVAKCSLDGTVVETYPSIKAAIRASGINKSAMIAAVHAERTIDGFVWRFVDPTHRVRQGWHHKQHKD